MTLRLVTLGGLRGFSEGVETDWLGSQRQRAALITYLTVERSATREALQVVFWPDCDTETARHRLSQTVYALRRVLGDGCIGTSGRDLRAGAALEADALEFENAIDAGRYQEAIRLYGGPFLAAVHLVRTLEFERWVDSCRARYARMFRKTCRALVDERITAGDLTGALLAARSWVVPDPLDDEAQHRLIELLAESGQRTEALKQYDSYVALLEGDELEPLDETRDLALRLRNGQVNGSLSCGAIASGGTDAETAIAIGTGVLQPIITDSPMGTPANRRRASRLVAGLAGLTLISTAAALIWNDERSPAPARPVLVASFENQTGDPSLDPIGDLLADWITEELARTAATDVVNARRILDSSRPPGSFDVEPDRIERIRSLAGQTTAEYVIAGAFYRLGDSLQFRAQVTDPGQANVLRAIEPTHGSLAAPSDGIAELSRRVLAVLAPLLDRRLPNQAQAVSEPPSFDAYRMYSEALELHVKGEFGQALKGYEAAVARDSSYLPALQKIAWVHYNQGHLTIADSMHRALNGRRERFSPWERATLDMLGANLHEGPDARYATARRAGLMAPGSMPNVRWAAQALILNRPAEATQILTQIDPSRGDMVGHEPYWMTLTLALHALGDHRRELREARRARALYPDNPAYLALEVRALAGLARPHDIDVVIREQLAGDDTRSPRAGELLNGAAAELGAHGLPDAARVLYARSVEWHRARLAGGPALQAGLGYALLGSNDLDGAAEVFRELAREQIRDVATRAMPGMLDAMQGRPDDARKVAADLPVPRHPGLNGERMLWRACIMAHLGDHDGAVTLLRQAVRQGATPFPHSHVCLRPLRDFQPFREMNRPRG